MREDAAALTDLWGRDTWTFAVVSDLKPGAALTAGRLAWVIGTSMPLRPDFQVWVNDRPVETKLGRQADIEWNMTEPRVRDAIVAEWADALENRVVQGEVAFPAAPGTDGPIAMFPALGPVSAQVRLFRQSVLATDEGRSYGFFVMVRGRLINPDDATLYLHDPSFATFYRTQFVIQADGLDEDLLANRERLADLPRVEELKVLQRALYLAARTEVSRRDAEETARGLSETLLPVESREFFRDPIDALLAREKGADAPDFPLSSPRVQRAVADSEGPMATVEATGFNVNVKHPFFAAVRDRLGGGRTAQEALRALDMVAVAERLLEGHLYDLGLADDVVQRVMAWRDQLFRQMADRYSGGAEELIAEVVDTSYTGDAPFERALAKLFRAMGFEAARDGASGKKDILVVAPTGETEERLTVEGKGRKQPIDNNEAAVGQAASHREAVHGKCALIVAREFTGFIDKTDPEVLQQCRAAGGVSIVTVETLIQLYRAVRRFFYPLETVVQALVEIESPADKLSRVDALANPVRQFPFGEFLELVWQQQKSEQAAGDVVPFRRIWQDHFRESVSRFEDFKNKVIGLDALSNGLMRLDVTTNEVTLRQAPAMIVEAINASLKLSEQLDA